jgi:hypothetical protein
MLEKEIRKKDGAAKNQGSVQNSRTTTAAVPFG